MIKLQIKNFSNDPSALSVEDDAAIQLKDRLQEELSAHPEAQGTIYILTNIRIFGQKRNDIDLLIIGLIDNFCIKNVKTKNYNEVKELYIRSFICNVELKSHASNGVKHEGTDYFVSYKGISHNASQQCFEAKFSLFNFLNDQLSIKPFICDVLWFNGLSLSDLTNMRGASLDNALHRGFNFRDLVNVMLRQAEVRKDSFMRFNLDSFNGGTNEYRSIVELFTKERKPQGLTKEKFELLSKKDTNVERFLQDVGEKLTIITGRAGTGKTVQLLQLAFLLANEDHANRCLILTYNQALVSDIKRLIDYTPMPTKVDGRTVAIRTIHSFFHTLMKEVGISIEKLIPSKTTYEYDYNCALKELHDFIVNECQQQDIEALKDMSDSHIDWDFIFIDEAQDFSDIEKHILFKIYGPKRLIVADGIDQFMRIGKRQMWEKGLAKEMVRKPKTMELERRQKANLVTFVNAFTRLVNLDWRVRPNDDLPGGQVIICPKFKKSLFDKLHQNCVKNNCENYDILILEPPTQVSFDDKGNRWFSKADRYKKAGIPIYDGINNQNRTFYPTKDQCRVYQYDSCRGLEGWCVVCADFDELVKYKNETYIPDENALGLDNDIIKKRSVFLWSLMPLTRPIDTLVITLTDKDSEVGVLLKQLADIYPDFVEWDF